MKETNMTELDKANGKMEAEEATKAKKPNLFKRGWNGLKSGIRKVRESPAATMIGVAIGAAATAGGMAIAHIVSAKAFREDEDIIEQEFEETDDEMVEPEDDVQDEEVA